MADDVLSYASPVPDDPPHPVMRDGENVVVRYDAMFPPRCIFCNRPAASCFRIQWSDASFRVTTIIRRYHFVYLCPEHARERRRHSLIAAWPMLAGLICFFAGYAVESGVIATLGLLFVGWGVLRVNDSHKLLKVKKLESHTVSLVGAGPSFLASLPPAPAEQ